MPDQLDAPPFADGEETPIDLDATVISTARQIEASSRRLATLVVVRGVEIGRHYPLRRSRVVLGRGRRADVRLPHNEISRAHAVIEALRWGNETIYRLSDLGSTNAVYVNGQRVERHVLGPGDKIQLGDAVLKFELLDAIDERFHTEIRNRIQYDDLTGLLTWESFRTALQWELERFATTVKGCSARTRIHGSTVALPNGGCHAVVGSPSRAIDGVALRPPGIVAEASTMGPPRPTNASITGPGASLARLTDSTPGSAETRSTSSRSKASRCSVV